MLNQINTATPISHLNPSQLKELQQNLARLDFYPSNQIDGIYGPNTAKGWVDFKASRHLNEPNLIGPSSVKMLLESDGLLIKREHFDSIFRHGTARQRDRYFLPLNLAMNEFRINTPVRMAAFLAQLAHESGSLKWEEEIASGAAYEGRRDLGNVVKGDGRRYKGRGPIQLTGRHNYRWYGKQLGLDLEGNPLLVKQPEIGSRVAALFWSSKGLNELADQNTQASFRLISRKINGGFNGLQDRLNLWSLSKNVLNV